MLEKRYHKSVNQANAKSYKTDMHRKEERGYYLMPFYTFFT